MSFKDFAGSHTGRRFFDNFAELVHGLKSLTEQMAVINQRDLEESQSVTLPCLSCNEMTNSENALALTYLEHTYVLCVACAKEKSILNDRLPPN